MFAGVPNKKCGHKVHTLSCRENHVQMGNLMDGPWYLSDAFDPMVLVRGFASKVLNLGFWSLVLGLYGFGP